MRKTKSIRQRLAAALFIAMLTAAPMSFRTATTPSLRPVQIMCGGSSCGGCC